MKVLLLTMMLLTSLAVSAKVSDNMENNNATSLPAPQIAGGKPFMEVLAERKSIREFSDKEIDAQTLSDMLWATVGVNRPEERKITAPTALNCQEIDLYVFTGNNVMKYNALDNTLREIVGADHRALVAAHQDFVLNAPVSIVFVADLNKLRLPTGEALPEAHARKMGCVDVGIACQNLNLFCANAGLATVPRASMDVDGIKKLLNLSDKQEPLMNNPVGYMK